MAKAKFVLIGVGSAVFGAGTIGDLLYFKDELWGSTISLVDIDSEALGLMVGLAKRMNEEAGKPFEIEWSSDRREVLSGADFIVTSAAVKREELWKRDWEVIREAGIRQTYGENGGPGALLLTLRNVEMYKGIFKDVEELAPDAWVINYSNPESRICMYLDRYTKLKFVGLCHQIMEGYRIVSRVLGIPIEELDIKASGINHCTWIVSIHERGSGRDVYEEFKEKVLSGDRKGLELSCKMLELSGLFPTAGDEHLAEMFPFGWEYVGLKGRDWEYWKRYKEEGREWVRGVVEGRRRVDEKIKGLSGERMAHMAVAMLLDRESYEDSMDVRNGGAIPNLPEGAIVEVPGIISGGGIFPLRMPKLPDVIAGFLERQVRVQELSVEAAVKGDRDIALQAMMLDPVVDNFSVAEKVLDELLEINREYISPGFFS